MQSAHSYFPLNAPHPAPLPALQQELRTQTEALTRDLRKSNDTVQALRSDAQLLMDKVAEAEAALRLERSNSQMVAAEAMQVCLISHCSHLRA